MAARKSNVVVVPNASSVTDVEEVVVQVSGENLDVESLQVGPVEVDFTQEQIDKENKVVDLESEIVKLSERLADLKKELRMLTKPESKSGPTKMELATQYWKDHSGLARKDYVAAFQKEFGLTLAGARTYIQLIMSKNK